MSNSNKGQAVRASSEKADTDTVCLIENGVSETNSLDQPGTQKSLETHLETAHLMKNTVNETEQTESNYDSALLVDSTWQSDAEDIQKTGMEAKCNGVNASPGQDAAGTVVMTTESVARTGVQTEQKNQNSLHSSEKKNCFHAVNKGDDKSHELTHDTSHDEHSDSACTDTAQTDASQTAANDLNADNHFHQENQGLLAYQSFCVPGLECFLEADQLIFHFDNLRYNQEFSDTAVARREVIDVTKRVVVHAEQEPPPLGEDSFLYRIYNKHKQEVMQVYNPGGALCMCCGINWHWCKRCHFQAVVYAPVGCILGFVKRKHTFFVQEFQVLDAQENEILTMRGAPQDLEIYTSDLENELGRLGRRWRGIMFELARSRQDYGLTLPLDLDVRFKAILVASVFCVHWVYDGRNR